MFKQTATYNNTTDLQEYSETVTAYITKCIDDVTVTKTITVRANQKPWLTGEVYRLLKAQNAAFRTGDEEGLKTARANLSRGIREAKRQYSRRIAIVSATAETLGACGRGFRTLRTTSPHHRPVTAPSPCWTSWMPSLLALRHKTAPLHKDSTSSRRPGDDAVPDSVRRSLSRINARKARVLTTFLGVYWETVQWNSLMSSQTFFNISLSQAVLPTCFKATTIIPVPKKSSPSCFNDYRPVALTPILMKCFWRLVMQHIKSVLPPSLDPFQFAYRSNRLTDDAIATALHPALTTPGQKNSNKQSSVYLSLFFFGMVSFCLWDCMLQNHIVFLPPRCCFWA